jgi:hypothetical protein
MEHEVIFISAGRPVGPGDGTSGALGTSDPGQGLRPRSLTPLAFPLGLPFATMAGD